ncbi:TPA: hypothetical protein UN036_000429 [Stenotrophomonas maltophilia]|nr:hypothetical protein [Stenotrophomonas maltophilia]
MYVNQLGGSMCDSENTYDEVDAGEDKDWLTVVAFNPAMSFDEDIEDELVIEQLSAVCRVEYLDDDGDECIAWFVAIRDKNGLHFDGPESLMHDELVNDYLYQCVSDALEEAIDSQKYDLGDTVEHAVIPVALRDAALTFEMVDNEFVHQIDDAHYVCSDRDLDPDDLDGRHLDTPAPYYAVERNSDIFIPIHSPADFVRVANNPAEQFQRARIQNHINAGQKEPVEVQRAVQVRRM